MNDVGVCRAASPWLCQGLIKIRCSVKESARNTKVGSMQSHPAYGKPLNLLTCVDSSSENIVFRALENHSWLQKEGQKLQINIIFVKLALGLVFHLFLLDKLKTLPMQCGTKKVAQLSKQLFTFYADLSRKKTYL